MTGPVLLGACLVAGSALLAWLAVRTLIAGARALEGARGMVARGLAGSRLLRGAMASPVPQARWARGRDLARLEVRGGGHGRLIVGRMGRRLLAIEERQSLLVLGPTQSYKTSGLAVPAILEWDGPVLATSVKGDLAAATAGWREQAGPVFVFDPSGATGLANCTWSLLGSCNSWTGAKRMAAVACEQSSAGSQLADGDFWYKTAAKLLAPLLFAAASAGLAMADVSRWLDSREEAEVEHILDKVGCEPAYLAAQASFGREERQRSSVYTTAEIAMEAFCDPAVEETARAHAGRRVVPEEILASSGTLHICSPSFEQRRLRPVFACLVSEITRAAYEQAARTGKALSPPLLVVLDEAANIAALGDLDGLASTAAAHGVQLVTIFQDLAQIEARYGARSATVVNNHRAKLVLSGVADPSTLSKLSMMIGDEIVWQPARTRGPAGSRSETRSRSTRRLAPEDAIRRIEPGTGVLLYGHLAPVRVALRPYFSDRVLAGRARSREAFNGRALFQAGAGRHGLPARRHHGTGET